MNQILLSGNNRMENIKTLIAKRIFLIGVVFFILGALSNIIVTGVNGGKMPVAEHDYLFTSAVTSNFFRRAYISTIDEKPKLSILGDTFSIGSEDNTLLHLSIGDIMSLVGYILIGNGLYRIVGYGENEKKITKQRKMLLIKIQEKK